MNILWIISLFKQLVICGVWWAIYTKVPTVKPFLLLAVTYTLQIILGMYFFCVVGLIHISPVIDPHIMMWAQTLVGVIEAFAYILLARWIFRVLSGSTHVA
jgi:hypothetical protein